ncbi:hypothetical protein F5B22DRAFT_145247 [Xylaria bambusicola]|uniref:uncharacterized protein n=1 Tax=Xylaria bambusicola TaxID=326684 RepID=UPI002007367B|nr:uncharacterized protein F5B22DRAFT_145247 [Xylaria bambusicola]KAI0517060.1 hypothetical protein F5B22DRAFT_145247 [Xylaria bambusicola]
MSASGTDTLYSELDKTSFFVLEDDKDVLRLVHDRFGNELERLKRAYSIHDPDAKLPSTESPSHILFGRQFDEVNRTLVGLLSLRWLYNDKYDTFCGAQPEAVALTRESFNWMRDMFQAGLKNNDDFIALLTSIVVNDLGKDPQLASDYCAKTGEDISAQNHDHILFKAVEAGLVPSFNRLSRGERADVLRGMKLGAELNFGQLAQAENVPVSLAALLELRERPRIFELGFMEQLLDIAGAGGHEDWTCAKVMIQPVLDAYRNVFEVSQSVIAGEIGLRDAYDLILVRRGRELREKGFRQLRVADSHDRALMRMLCMGRVISLETAHLYDSALEDLEVVTKASLIASLNVDGSVGQPAVIATYAPAFFTHGVSADGAGSGDEKRRRVQSLMRYLARVLKLDGVPTSSSAVVVERNLLEVIQDIVDSDEFRANPEVLDKQDVPKGVIAQTI